jgi:hypothetical protein
VRTGETGILTHHWCEENLTGRKEGNSGMSIKICLMNFNSKNYPK